MGREYFYKPGSFYRQCDRTGFTTRADRTQMEWNNLIVDRRVFEPRQPQDFVRGVNDDQTVPNARPRPIPPFQGPIQTWLTAAANIADVNLKVYTSARWYAGDNIQIVLDSGGTIGTFSTSLIFVHPNGADIVIKDKLPWTASVNNVLTNLAAISQPNIG